MHTGNLRIETLVLGPIQTNCIVLAPETGGPCCVVDPSEPLGPLLEYLNQEKLEIATIVITHGHGDHLSGVERLMHIFPKAEFMAPAGDEFMLADHMANLSAPFGMPATAPQADKLIEPGETISLAGCDWHVLDSSGHTPGGITLYCRAEATALCGDAIFCGSIGRCDLPGADMDRLVANLKHNILPLPDETILIPGHGPATTVGAEKRSNPYLI